MYRIVIIAGALAALAAPAFAADSILPGYWETTSRVTAPIASSTTEKRCIAPADVAKFMEGPSNRHYACTYPTREISGGKIVLKGQCVAKNGQQIAVQGQGDYTPTSFHLAAEIQTNFYGLTISGKADTDAKRLGDTCPPDAKTSDAGKGEAAKSN